KIHILRENGCPPAGSSLIPLGRTPFRAPRAVPRERCTRTAGRDAERTRDRGAGRARDGAPGGHATGALGGCLGDAAESRPRTRIVSSASPRSGPEIAVF